MSLIVDEHRQYLSDPVRVGAFGRAIAAVVRPGDVVVDLGCGTGILGMLACRAGARRIYAIEPTGMIEIARALANANGLGDRFVFLQQHSTEAVLPEQADVLVSDFIGRMGFDNGLFEIYADAGRFMKPGARRIPASLAMSATAVEDAEQFEHVRFWDRPCAGLDMSAARVWARNTGYPRLLAPQALLSDETVSIRCRSDAREALVRLRGDVVVGRAGTMHGLGAWFDADLGGGVTLSNAPLAAERLNRRNVFFPLDQPVDVERGDRVSIHVRIRPAEIIVNWDVEIHSARGRRVEQHSTLDGMLISREELRANAPESTPRLTPRGLARRSILALCDGQRSLADIEREVFRRHPELFASSGEAQAFVAEVVTRYAEPDA